MGSSTGYRAALRVPTVRRLWAAAAASTIGDYVGQGALLFLALDRSGLTIGVAAVLAVGVIPSLLTGIVAGSWLDRLPRRVGLVGAQIIGAAVVTLPVFFGGLAPVLAAAALLAAIRTATFAIRSGAMADGVDDDQRGPLVALLGTTDQGAQVLGYLTGGALYVLVGPTAALLLDAGSFLVGAVVLAGLTLPRQRVADEARPPMTAGLTHIARDPVLRLLAVLAAITAAVSALPETLAPTVASEDDPWRPVVLAAAPLGQAVTFTAAGRLTAIRRPSFQLLHMVTLPIGFGLAALSSTPAAIAGANVLVGVGVAWLVGPQLTFVRLAPRARMAQITSAMVATLAMAEGLGSLALGALADVAGVGTVYWVAGAVVLVAAIGGWLIKERTPQALALDRDELPRATVASAPEASPG